MLAPSDYSVLSNSVRTHGHLVQQMRMQMWARLRSKGDISCIAPQPGSWVWWSEWMQQIRRLNARPTKNVFFICQQREQQTEQSVSGCWEVCTECDVVLLTRVPHKRILCTTLTFIVLSTTVLNCCQWLHLQARNSSCHKELMASNQLQPRLHCLQIHLTWTPCITYMEVNVRGLPITSTIRNRKWSPN